MNREMFVLAEVLDRKYTKTEDGVKPISVVDNLNGVFNKNYSKPDRVDYLKLVEEILGYTEEVQNEAYKEHVSKYRGFTEEHFFLRVDDFMYYGLDGKYGTEGQIAVWLLMFLYNEFKAQVYSLMEENFVLPEKLEHHKEMSDIEYGDMLRMWVAKGEGIVFNYREMQRAQYTRENIDMVVSSLNIYILFMNNLIDVFGHRIKDVIGILDETPNQERFLIDETQIVDGKELVNSILFVINSEELYIISDGIKDIDVPEDEEALLEIQEILDKVTEDIVVGVGMLSPHGREEIIKGYITKEMIESMSVISRKKGTIQEAFSIMRSSTTIGDNAVIMFEEENQNPHISKPVARKYLEELLTEWWADYKNGKSISVTVANNRITKFKSKCNNEYGRLVEIKSNDLMSPTLQRVIIANNGIDDLAVFRRIVADFRLTLEDASRLSDGGISTNKFLKDNGLVEIIDINIYM